MSSIFDKKNSKNISGRYNMARRCPDLSGRLYIELSKRYRRPNGQVELCVFQINIQQASVYQTGFREVCKTRRMITCWRESSITKWIR